MANYWISKTHVRIEPSEMTREEALAMARELVVELVEHPARHSIKWTPERDAELKALREQKLSTPQIALRMFGDASRAIAIRTHIARLGLPVSDGARKSGRASADARRARPTAVA